jgi:hypothetical protein
VFASTKVSVIMGLFGYKGSREKEQIKFCFDLKIFSKKSVYWLFQRFFTIDVS